MSNSFVAIIWSYFGRWGVQLFSITVFLFSAKILTLEEYGSFALLMAIVILNELVSRECLENYLASKIEPPKIPATHLIWVSSFFLVLVMASLVVSKNKLNIEVLDFGLVFFMLLLQWCAAFLKGIALRERKYKDISVVLLFSSSLSAGFGVFLLLYGAGVSALIFQQFLFWLLLSVTLLRVSCRSCIEVVGLHNKDYLWIEYCKVSVPSSFLSVVNNRADIVFVSVMFSSDLLGVFSFIKRLFQIGQDLLSSGMERFMVVGRSSEERAKLYFVKVLVVFGAMVSILLALGTVVLPELLTFVFGSKWVQSYELLEAFSIICFFGILVSICRAELVSRGLVLEIFKAKFFELLVLFFGLWISMVNFDLLLFSLLMAIKTIASFFLCYWLGGLGGNRNSGSALLRLFFAYFSILIFLSFWGAGLSLEPLVVIVLFFFLLVFSLALNLFFWRRVGWLNLF